MEMKTEEERSMRLGGAASRVKDKIGIKKFWEGSNVLERNNALP